MSRGPMPFELKKMNKAAYFSKIYYDTEFQYPEVVAALVRTIVILLLL
jgi:hypothetical protein